MSKILKYQAIRFHSPAFILGKTLTGFTPKEQPNIVVRQTEAGDFEFCEFEKKTGMMKVAWVPSTTIESVMYYEEAPKK